MSVAHPEKAVLALGEALALALMALLQALHFLLSALQLLSVPLMLASALP